LLENKGNLFLFVKEEQQPQTLSCELVEINISVSRHPTKKMNRISKASFHLSVLLYTGTDHER